MFVVQGAVLKFEDFDFTRFVCGLEFDVAFAECQEEGAAFVFGGGEKLLVLRGGEHVLDGGVAEGGEGVADQEEDEAPGKEVCGDEEEAGDEEENDVEHAA